jgi:hypothetical protein
MTWNMEYGYGVPWIWSTMDMEYHEYGVPWIWNTMKFEVYLEKVLDVQTGPKAARRQRVVPNMSAI